MFNARTDVGTSIRYSDFRSKVVEGTVSEVQIGTDRIVGKFKNGDSFTTIPVPNDNTLTQLLQDNQVKYAGKEAFPVKI